MAFQTPITVREAVESISQRKYLLPAIQRELVWAASQIERLFDSLMRDYPVGSFLFWHVDRHKNGDYQFYEFIRTYHQRDSRHNPKANVAGDADVTAILDGQQRLTSLFIGLKGTYAYKGARKRWDNNSSFPERKLYLNLLQGCAPDEDTLDKLYDFRFLTSNEAQESNASAFWFEVGKILDIHDLFAVTQYLAKNGLSSIDEEKARFASSTLHKLFAVVHTDKTINYFLEMDESLDKVLNIFIRVNSGGTTLSYSDLLLSIATAQWKTRDAREEITDFVDEINKIGDGFNFDKDFVLKTCLVLSDKRNIAFKVDNFGRSNMLDIETRWDSISKAIRLAVALVASFGYSRDTLTSNNAVIPIAYFLLKKNNPDNFDVASSHSNDRDAMQKWLIRTLLKRVFSGQADTVIGPVCEIIKRSDDFPLDAILSKFKGGPKALAFNDDEIQNLFVNRYGDSYTFSTLALLYPTLDFRNKFHLDHIYPKSLFTPSQLQKQGVPESKHEVYTKEFNYLANLQLLEGGVNIAKSAKHFDAWLSTACPTPQQRRDYMAKHYIPGIDLSFLNFDIFIAERSKLMRQKFESLLK